MPIYEYACMECESHFEELVRGDRQPPCPHCGAEKVRRQLSVFVSRAAAPVGETRPAGGRSGGCCGGSCGCGH